MSDPVMDRILREQRRFNCWLWPILALAAAVAGTLGWMAGSAPPRPIVVQFGTEPLHVQVER